jgi:ribosomal protein L32E
MGNNAGKGKFYRTKLVYWRKGFDWREPQLELVVVARRLDSEAPLVAAGHASAVFITGNTPAVMTAINIPVVGCWEIAASYKGNTLSYVVSVEP